MTRQYFKFPFAELGDTETIPQLVQLDGSISMQEGYGPNYSLDPLTDPDALDVPREGENELFFLVTQALQQLQQDGTPDFITNGDNLGTDFPYTFNQRALYSGQAYRSLIDSNTDLPNAGIGSWQVENLYITGTAAGTANAIELWPTQAYQPFQFGDTVQFIASSTNTDTVTLQVGTESAIPLMKATALGVVDLDPNDVSIGLNTAIFDGTEWILLNPSNLGQITQYAQVTFQSASDISLPANTLTKVAYDGTVLTDTLYDPNGWWDSGNFRFVPTIAGVYRVNAISHISSSAMNNTSYHQVNKTGTLIKRLGEAYTNDSDCTITGSIIVPMNGSTDYLEIWAAATSDSILGAGGSDANTLNLFEIQYLGSYPSMLLEKVKRAQSKRVPYVPSEVLSKALNNKEIRKDVDRQEFIKAYGSDLQKRREKLQRLRIELSKRQRVIHVNRGVKK